MAVIDPRALETMRAYLARSETRLSTLHRIAGVFLNGAGLLALFSVFFRDAVLEIGSKLIRLSPAIRTPHSSEAWWQASFVVPVGISLLLTVYSFYVLLRELVTFYFVPEHFGAQAERFYPRFALEALALSKDEDPKLKTEVIARHRSGLDLRRIVLPYHQKDRDYFRAVREQVGREAILSTRAALTAQPTSAETREQASDREDFELFNVAFGMAGGVDRDLVDEVARMESVLVRHALNLRRLVLRYMKALIVAVTTVMASLAVEAVLRRHEVVSTGLMKHWQFVIASVYLVWAVFTIFAVHSVLVWIQHLGSRDTSLPWNPWRQPDKALADFEKKMALGCIIVVLLGVAQMIRYWPTHW